MRYGVRGDSLKVGLKKVLHRRPPGSWSRHPVGSGRLPPPACRSATGSTEMSGSMGCQEWSLPITSHRSVIRVASRPALLIRRRASPGFSMKKSLFKSAVKLATKSACCLFIPSGGGGLSPADSSAITGSRVLYQSSQAPSMSATPQRTNWKIGAPAVGAFLCCCNTRMSVNTRIDAETILQRGSGRGKYENGFSEWHNFPRVLSLLSTQIRTS